MSPTRRFLRGPRLVALALLVLVVGAELALRAFTDYGWSRLADTSERYGYVLVPNQTVREERDSVEHVNSWGYRDTDWAPPGARPDVLRLAVLGNSVPYGAGVNDEEVWPEVLEELLRARLFGEHGEHGESGKGGKGGNGGDSGDSGDSGERGERGAAATVDAGDVGAAPVRSSFTGVEVMNFSVPGYVVEQMKRVTLDQVLDWRPSLVLLAVGPDAILPMRPRADAVRYPGRRLVQRSALWHFLDLNLRRRAELAIEDAVSELQRRARSAPYAPEQQPLWDAVLVALDDLATRVLEIDARVVLVENALLVGVLHPERVPPSMSLERWADARGGVEWVPVAPALGESMAELLAEIAAGGLHARDFWNRDEPGAHALEHRDQAAFFEDGPYHLTPRGHRVVARAVIDGLVARGLVP